MDSGLTLERELLHLLGTGRNAGVAARYYGFDGRGGDTLRTVGKEIGLTYERVRQIVSAASESILTGRPVSPTLDRTIAFVVDRMPAAAGEIEAELRSQQLTAGLFRLEGVIKATELLGRRLPFSITEVAEERLVHAPDNPSVDTIVRIARRLISRQGMATLSHVRAAVRKVESGVCDRKLVASVLACLKGFHWLEQSTGWFWLSDSPKNRVLNRIREILSVANPIHISELRVGIARDYRIWGFSPPKSVLLEFCRQAPGLRVNDETVQAEPGVNLDDVLGQTKRDIVRVLSEHGGTMAKPEFTSKLTLEKELRELLGTGRNAFIAARYYGFDGRGGDSLQAVGNEIGVTRERVRQIVSAASKWVRTGQAVSPTLDRTIAFVVDHMPARAEEIEAALRFQRLTAGLFRLEGVLKAAELLGRRLPFLITEVGEERLVHARDMRSVDTIARIARRVISRWGMTTLSTVVAEVRKVESDLCDIKLVASAVACLKGFHWLEQSAGWFWLSDTRHNPVLNRMRKILSIASPIHISQLWAGIGRDPRMKGFSPPKRVILEFCRQAPELQVNDETVQAEPVINSDDVLGQTERDIFHMLSEHGGIMATSEFKSVCLGMDVNRRTFYLNLMRSPIIARYGGHLYGLIGSGETPAVRMAVRGVLNSCAKASRMAERKISA
jgi:hypothetical protein